MGFRIGNWLTLDQGQTLLQTFDRTTLRGKRDHAMVAVLPGCGLRRAELAAINVGSLQRREEHWVFADLIGQGGHVRTGSSSRLGRLRHSGMVDRCGRDCRTHVPCDQQAAAQKQSMIGSG